MEIKNNEFSSYIELVQGCYSLVKDAAYLINILNMNFELSLLIKDVNSSHHFKCQQAVFINFHDNRLWRYPVSTVGIRADTSYFDLFER